jgi:glycosyltransferase involved in cell wall biosynthesis
VIDAFRHSGLAGNGAALVVKVQNVNGNEADFAALQASVRDLKGTVLLSETLSRADIHGLESACDCFVSLHRSEGFGLAVAECMLLGKPVISTDWSATAEFLTRENGLPVRARLVTLEQNHGPYAKGSTWADPDPAHAAEHMRTVFNDRPLAQRLGAAARETIRTRFSPAVIGARYRRRLESIATF